MISYHGLRGETPRRGGEKTPRFSLPGPRCHGPWSASYEAKGRARNGLVTSAARPLKVARYGIQLLLATLMPLALQWWDLRRLSPEQRARVWNFASWASALYAFNILSMLGWCWVTRRSVWGLLLGVVSVAVLVTALVVLDYGVGIALGFVEPAPWEALFE